MANSILTIKKFLGLNENPDGDTKIKNGELSELRNFRITMDGHLQVRPGSATVFDLRAAWDAWCAVPGNTAPTDAPAFSGAWSGILGTSETLLCAFGGVIFKVNPSDWTSAAVGTCTQDKTSFFGFGGKVYLLNGHEYKAWSGTAGTSFSEVTGYVPIVQTATSPSGAGTTLQPVNRLTGLRRVKFSPDGSATAFQLPETGISAVTEVSGTSVTYTTDLTAGKLTFASAVAKGTNTVTVTYRKGDGARAEVAGMRFCETFNGSTDTRVFLYGDGTNKTIYSGLDYDGNPTAEYFPDLYEMSVGESNTPITALVRHYSRLVVYKTNSVYSCQYGIATLDDSSTTAAFYCTPVNRELGNEAMGQVRLVENNPLSLCSSSIYEWKSTSSSGNLVSDERTAKRISDRVWVTTSEMNLSETETFNDRDNYEFWFCRGNDALILNYSNDAWYRYSGIPAALALKCNGKVLAFGSDGKVRHISRQYRNDDGAAIDARAATGSMDFEKEWMRKYSTLVFVSIQPEDGARVLVTAESNRRSDYPEKVVSANMATFLHVDYNHFSFNTNRKPQVKRIKLKVKKATFYKLVFESNSATATATVLQADVQLRYSGNVK
ncbi:hypothetical protein [Oscillibacter sp.]|uniref:hypothetical protein n=1 Tax=Oscillibacter sp. TaxID=1945593 RepID=UPI003390F043